MGLPDEISRSPFRDHFFQRSSPLGVIVVRQPLRETKAQYVASCTCQTTCDETACALPGRRVDCRVFAELHRRRCLD
jgi:hypothetical protein